jgi:uncharacterized SAM-binding protein YcdF (DUF218 family)
VADRRPSKLRVPILLAVIVLLALTHSTWMGWLGALLVESEPPVPSDLIVVLGGDPNGARILKAAELVKKGYASKALVSGAPGPYDLHESDLAIPFVLKHGYPATWFIPFPHNAHSTEEEAQALLAELHKLHAQKVIVATSDYHSRRALRTLRARWPGIAICMVAVPDQYFSPYGWWHTREGRKTFLLEWTKTFAGLVGM